MSDLLEFMKILEYDFREERLLDLALTHPSCVREDLVKQHNQRLEFLGDAVLQLVLTAELYHKYPAISEGPLTKARAQMVNRRTLAEQAKSIDMGRFLRVSKGEESCGGRERSSTLADAFEAVIGAIYLDGGFEAARVFLLKQFRHEFVELEDIPNLDNPKGELQELLQSDSLESPVYRLETTQGPDHNRVFDCTVHHGGVELGRGQGPRKKDAESAAALSALKSLRMREK
jgi:ribonuclease-3